MQPYKFSVHACSPKNSICNTLFAFIRFVGGFGIGPKYLVDEYAILDTRYWVLQDPMVMWVCYQEFFIMLPLEYIWYMALQKRHWSRHYWVVITGKCSFTCICVTRVLAGVNELTILSATTGTFQLMGTIFYMGVEWTEDFKHMPITVSVARSVYGTCM